MHRKVRGNSRPLYMPGGERVFRFLVAVFVYSLALVYSLKTLLGLEFPGEKNSHKGERIDEFFLLGAFVTGILASLLLILVYEASHALLWFLFVAYLLAIISYIVTLGGISGLDEKTKKELGIKYERAIFTVSYGPEKPGKIRVRERTIMLGLSINTGICGIITTLAATLLKAPLTFTLVPVTFDMFSVLTALIEFPGISVIPMIFERFRMLKVSALTMLLAISWSLYLGGAVRVILLSLNLLISTSTLATLVSGIWVLMAVILSIFLRRLELTRKTVVIGVVLSLLPFALLLL